MNVALSVTLPEPENVHSLARSYTDSEIKNVDVLVFDEEGKFMERVKVDGGELTPSGTEISFSIRLDATSKRRVIHLVTNGRSPDGGTDRLNFNDITSGECSYSRFGDNSDDFRKFGGSSDAFDYVGTC